MFPIDIFRDRHLLWLYEEKLIFICNFLFLFGDAATTQISAKSMAAFRVKIMRFELLKTLLFCLLELEVHIGRHCGLNYIQGWYLFLQLLFLLFQLFHFLLGATSKHDLKLLGLYFLFSFIDAFENFKFILMIFDEASLVYWTEIWKKATQLFFIPFRRIKALELYAELRWLDVVIIFLLLIDRPSNMDPPYDIENEEG